MSLALLLIGSTVLLALGWRRDDLRTLRVSADAVDVLWVLAIAAWPTVVTYLLAPLVFPGDAAAQVAGAQFPILQYAPAMIMSLVALGRAVVAGRMRIDPPALVLGALLLVGFASLVIDGSGQVVNLVVAGILVVGTFIRTREVGLALIACAARLALFVVVVSVTVAVFVAPAAATSDCRSDKCNIAQQVVSSPFAGNGNAAGLAAAILLPFVLVRLSWLRLLATSLGVAAYMEATASRTAMIGVAVAFVIAAGLILIRDARLRTVWATAVLVAAGAFSILPLYANYIDDDFSFRGQLWTAAKHLVVDNPLLGYGPTYWQTMGLSALFDANYSPHNGWLDIAVGMGLVGCAGIIAIVALQVLTTDNGVRAELIGYYAVILSISALESVYVPYYLGIVPAAAVLPLLMYHPVRRWPTVASTGVRTTAVEPQERIV